MRSEPLRLTGVALLALLSGPALAAPGNDPSGVWVTETGQSRIKIAPCGQGFCGTLVAAPGKALDDKNPDPAQRSRSVIGVQILDARKPEGDGYVGTLYNPTDGKTYSGSIHLKDATRLEVTGCVLSILCKTQNWTRSR